MNDVKIRYIGNHPNQTLKGYGKLTNGLVITVSEGMAKFDLMPTGDWEYVVEEKKSKVRDFSFKINEEESNDN